MNNLLLARRVLQDLSLLSREERSSIRKYLSILQGNPRAGVKLRGHYEGLSLFRPAPGLQIVYRVVDGDIWVVAVLTEEHYQSPARERVSAVILAAGKSQGHSIDGIVEMSEIFSRTMVDEVILVLGYRAEAVKEQVAGEKIRIVVNPDYEGGLSRSLRCGLRAVTGDTSAVFLALGNQGFIDSSLLDNLLQIYRHERSSIVAPSRGGRHMHPLIFDRMLLPELLKVRGNVGGRDVIRRHEGEIRNVHIA